LTTSASQRPRLVQKQLTLISGTRSKRLFLWVISATSKTIRTGSSIPSTTLLILPRYKIPFSRFVLTCSCSFAFSLAIFSHSSLDSLRRLCLMIKSVSTFSEIQGLNQILAIKPTVHHRQKRSLSYHFLCIIQTFLDKFLGASSIRMGITWTKCSINHPSTTKISKDRSKPEPVCCCTYIRLLPSQCLYCRKYSYLCLSLPTYIHSSQ